MTALSFASMMAYSFSPSFRTRQAPFFWSCSGLWKFRVEGRSMSMYDPTRELRWGEQLQLVSISKRTLTVCWFSGTWMTSVFSTIVLLLTVVPF